MNKWGIHLTNGENADLPNIAATGVSNITLLHYQAEYIPFWRREVSKDGLILVRYYDKGFLAKNPKDYAKAVAEEAEKWRQWGTDHWVFANEMNLEMESGPGYDDVQRVIDWIVAVARELRTLCPWMKIHAPAFSPTGNWTEYYRRLAAHLEMFDVIDLHVYGTLESMVNISRNAMLWFPQTSSFFVSELNGPGSLEYFKWVETESRVLAATYFIWFWQNADPNWHGDLRGSALEEEIRRAPKKRIGGATMPKAAIALLPSNQDRNKSSIIDNYREAGGMNFLTPSIEQVLREAGHNARHIPTGFESTDSYKLENLIRQVEAANEWLDKQPESVKFLVSYHTDSGAESHTYGIYGTTREAESKKIAEHVGNVVHEALGTKVFRSFDKVPGYDYNTYVFYDKARYPSVLIELISHENRRDIEFLYANPHLVGPAIVQGVQAYLGPVVQPDWKREAETYRDKNRELMAALERERGRIKFIKEAVANA